MNTTHPLTISDIQELDTGQVEYELFNRDVPVLVPGKRYKKAGRVNVLNRVLLLLASEPNRLEMSTWGVSMHVDKKSGPIIASYHLSDSYENRTDKKPACGTVACLAGWTATMFPDRENRKMVMMAEPIPEEMLKPRHQQESENIKDYDTFWKYRTWWETEIIFKASVRAGEVLEIESEENLDRLFLPPDWPKSFRDEYFNAPTNFESVRVLARRIQHFLNTCR